MLIAAVFLIAGIALVVWGAERVTDGALGVARALRVSAFWIGALVSGLEPENLATGVVAILGGFQQLALGTVIGSAVFMLTAGLGLALLIVPMDVHIPRAGAGAMAVALAGFGVVMADGFVTRVEGAILVAGALGLMAWLWRSAPVFQAARDDDDDDAPPSVRRTVLWLGLGTAAILVGAELLVTGARGLLSTTGISETFLGMVVVGLGESVEETARMVAPARRGHPDLALGNVVGTLVVLLLFNLGVIALVQPVVAEALVLRLHAPFLAACIALVAGALLVARRLGRAFGGLLVAGYVLYLAINVRYAW